VPVSTAAGIAFLERTLDIFPGLKPWAEGYGHFVARIDPKRPLFSAEGGSHRSSLKVKERHISVKD
jgi:hypothetical protein